MDKLNIASLMLGYFLALKVRSHDPILSDPIVLDPIVLDPIVGSCEHMNNWIQLFIDGWSMRLVGFFDLVGWK